ncbi:YegS/Rv2252/BmrU family lipid kinase [Arhodomonas aquaeolei]|uniref:YegS/Rv2252/BmrU family lipid kinase n=1 Tax=Arhodomonas aquaeolei TaxID=2369 RepID=UPI0021691739|nr:YegS/Rv2252/BmrU family lipid kinase [Arhodomonas aquaeolei]MCS4503465.1 YegS/Rv2252/BmrU family lipid kinase [Arhodomonas aquaeolei]
MLETQSQPHRGEPRRRLAVFANAAAGRAGGPLDAALAVFERCGVEYRCHWPANGDALRAGIAAVAATVDAVVVAGGDGTVNAALGALAGGTTPLAVLPLGTANDLARTLGIPFDPADAAAIAVDGSVHRIDLGRVNGRYFCNVAHIGLGVRARNEGLGEGDKRRWRALSYPVALLRTAGRLRSFRLEVEVDGRTERLRALHFAVGNGRYYGGGVPVQAEAGIDDGLLDAYCVPPQGRLGLLRAAWDVWRGGVAGSPVWRAQAQVLTVRTRRHRRILADGEIIAYTPATFEVCPGELPVVIDPGSGDAASAPSIQRLWQGVRNVV